MPTKEELETQLAAAQARIDELEAAAGDRAQGGAAAATPPRPQHPDFGLSAGEVNDLQTNGVTTSPFTGSVLNALDLGITPGNPEALANAERERKSRKKTDDTAPPEAAAAPKVPAGVKAAANALTGN